VCGAAQRFGEEVQARKGEDTRTGSETVDPLESLARVLSHIPDKGQVMQRHHGWYANRPRGDAAPRCGSWRSSPSGR